MKEYERCAPISWHFLALYIMVICYEWFRPLHIFSYDLVMKLECHFPNVFINQMLLPENRKQTAKICNEVSIKLCLKFNIKLNTEK